MSIENTLREWDGKSVDFLQRVYAHGHEQDNFFEDVISLISDSTLEVAATWLARQCILDGSGVNKQQAVAVLTPLLRGENWQAMLHVLQCLDFLPIDRETKPQVEATLRYSLDHPNKFVRAWSYSGLARLAELFPALQTEVAQLVALALKDESASVKARIRQSVKRHDFLVS